MERFERMDSLSVKASAGTQEISGSATDFWCDLSVSGTQFPVCKRGTLLPPFSHPLSCKHFQAGTDSYYGFV